MTWVEVDYVTSRKAATKIAGDGTGTATFTRVDDGELWQITRAVVACTGTPAGTVKCLLHVVSGGDSPTVASLRSGTLSGMFDEADYPGDGLAVGPDEQLHAVWSGAPASQSAVCTLTYRQLRRA